MSSEGLSVEDVALTAMLGREIVNWALRRPFVETIRYHDRRIRAVLGWHPEHEPEDVPVALVLLSRIEAHVAGTPKF